jgi:CheY-like chemotaxis protein
MILAKRFIVVDDDPVNLILCRRGILNELPDIDVQTFEKPEEALDYIWNEYPACDLPSVLLLDINMPGMTGWDFMKVYEKFDAKIRKLITIYILSSPTDMHDIETAHKNKNVTGYIVKPLSSEQILFMSTGK